MISFVSSTWFGNATIIQQCILIIIVLVEFQAPNIVPSIIAARDNPQIIRFCPGNARHLSGVAGQRQQRHRIVYIPNVRLFVATAAYQVLIVGTQTGFYEECAVRGTGIRHYGPCVIHTKIVTVNVVIHAVHVQLPPRRIEHQIRVTSQC